MPLSSTELALVVVQKVFFSIFQHLPKQRVNNFLFWIFLLIQTKKELFHFDRIWLWIDSYCMRFITCLTWHNNGSMLSEKDLRIFTNDFNGFSSWYTIKLSFVTPFAHRNLFRILFNCNFLCMLFYFLIKDLRNTFRWNLFLNSKFCL